MKKKNIPFLKVLKNNLLILKICFKECPWHLTYFAFMNIVSEIVMFFEWVFGIKYVLESVEFNYPLSRPVTFLCIMLVVHTINALLGGFCWHNIWQKAQKRMQKAIKTILYEKARTLDLECYDNPEYYDKYVLTINEANNMINRATQLLQMAVMSVTNIVLYGGFYLSEDKISVLFVLVSFVLTYVFSIISNKVDFSKRMECNPIERRREYIHRVHYLSDYAKELRLNPEYTEVLNGSFVKVNNELENINRKYGKKKFVLEFLKSYISSEFIIEVLFLIYLVYRAAVMKAISYSEVVVLFNSAQRLKNSFKRIAELFPYAQETSLYVDKMNEFLAYSPNITGGVMQIDNDEHTLKLDNVGFSYNNTDYVLNGINLEIKPKDKIAVVGYNGAGKTTLVKLLLRLYDATDGTIFLDGKNITDYKLNDYRNLFGTAFQDFKIFACSLRENVTLSTDKADDSEVTNVLESAGMASKLSALKDGLDTQLTTEFSDDGVNLSGGEAQKTAIARAFYRKAPIIILDEPSAALDPISEYEFNNSVLKEGKDKTVVFISHRLSTTRNADKIIMLENGQIIEYGSHSELLKQDGKYAQMWRVQAGQYTS